MFVGRDLLCKEIDFGFFSNNCHLSDFNSLPDAFYRVFDELERGVLYTPHVMKSGIELTYPPEYIYVTSLSSSKI